MPSWVFYVKMHGIQMLFHTRQCFYFTSGANCGLDTVCFWPIYLDFFFSGNFGFLSHAKHIQTGDPDPAWCCSWWNRSHDYKWPGVAVVRALNSPSESCKFKPDAESAEPKILLGTIIWGRLCGQSVNCGNPMDKRARPLHWNVEFPLPTGDHQQKWVLRR